MKDRVLLASDLQIHGRRLWYPRSTTLCGQRVPFGARGTSDRATCTRCIAELEVLALRAPPDDDRIDVDVLCGECGAKQTERLEAEAPAREALAEIVCLFCGDRGRFSITTVTDDERILIQRSRELAGRERDEGG